MLQEKRLRRVEKYTSLFCTSDTPIWFLIKDLPPCLEIFNWAILFIDIIISGYWGLIKMLQTYLVNKIQLIDIWELETHSVVMLIPLTLKFARKKKGWYICKTWKGTIEIEMVIGSCYTQRFDEVLFLLDTLYWKHVSYKRSKLIGSSLLILERQWSSSHVPKRFHCTRAHDE